MLYRFRNTDTLLGDRHELEQQYMYFTPPADQNDPMEGFVDYFWKGDKIAWLGLFKHYIWQLYITLLNAQIGLPIENLKNLFLSRTEIHFKNAAIGASRITIENRFACNRLIQEISEILGDSKYSVKEMELKTILLLIHGTAIQNAYDLLVEEEHLNPKMAQEIHDLKINSHSEWSDTAKDFVNFIVKGNCNIDALNSYITSLRVQLYSFTVRNEDFLSFLLFDFSTTYIDKIKSLAFENWYAVCFNKCVNNPAMWSYYADNHKGVCLIFNNTLSSGITLEPLTASCKEGATHFDIYPIDYNQPPVTADFFSLLGNLWGDERYHWFVHNETRSSVVDSFNDRESWRNMYWDIYTKRFLRKSKAWENECECRIILKDYIYDHIKPEQRKYKYDFKDLEGIVFGIRTPLSAKSKIIEVIETKCREHNRESFNIYQAEYDKQKENIIFTKILDLGQKSSDAPP